LDYFESSILINRIKDIDLLEEKIILFSKLSQHENSLNILLFKMNDYTSIEKYCLNTYPSEKENDTYFENKKRNELFLILLKIIFNNKIIDNNLNINNENLNNNIENFNNNDEENKIIERQNFAFEILNKHR
jgi:hypothetical protein